MTDLDVLLKQIKDRITTLYELRESDDEEMKNWVRSISDSLGKLWHRVYAIEEHLGVEPAAAPNAAPGAEER